MDHAAPEAAAARERAAVELLARHESTFRGAARRVSICADDAEDAVQRAVEILLTKAPPIPLPRLARWMTVVTRREALAVRRDRERLLGERSFEPPLQAGQVDFADALPSAAPGPEEACERAERVARAQRALRLLSDSQRLAIVLQAEGYSYAEICERLGWTYTKVNRSLAEGRARLRSLARRDGRRSVA